MYAVEITCLTLIAVLALRVAADFAILANVSARVQPPCYGETGNIKQRNIIL